MSGIKVSTWIQSSCGPDRLAAALGIGDDSTSPLSRMSASKVYRYLDELDGCFFIDTVTIRALQKDAQPRSTVDMGLCGEINQDI
ncbi:hypothetical protein ACHQM5_000255 [Ranunculus cassubicifolius]